MKKVLLSVVSILTYVLSFANLTQVDTTQFTGDSVVNNATEESRNELDKSIFNNVVFKGGPGEGKLTWSISYDVIDQLKGDSLIITYNTKIGAKRAKKNFEGAEWIYTEAMPVTATSFTIKDLKEAEKYVFKIGLAKNGNLASSYKDKEAMIWSDKIKGKTKRGWGIFKFLILIGSLGLFIYGMKVMSEGLQQTAGARLRNWLRSITSNRFKGVLTGFGITSIVQSSSVTTVMTVSFVNAGLMNLRESAGVMMGANIGTTITAWLVLLLGFKVSISSYALVLIALVFPLIFMNRGKSKAIAQSVIGFSILFLGLHALKDAVPDVDANSDIVQFFTGFKDSGFLGTIMFVALGAIVTVVIQSSSAAMTLTMTMVAKGIIPFEVAGAMILGENIGTTITAELASLVGNVHAKRSARIHSLFNVIGVTWIVLIFPFFTDFVGFIVEALSGKTFDPTNVGMANEGIAVLHTSFNLINVILLIWFVPQLVSFAERTVKSKGGTDEEFHLEFIGGATIVDTPEISIFEAKKEVAKFGEITSRMSGFTKSLLIEPDKKKKTRLIEKIGKYEEITDRVEVEVAKYLNRVSEGELSESNSREIHALNSITNDLERIGDIFFQISKAIERKDQEQIWFSPEQRENITKMLDLIDEAFNTMVSNLSLDKDVVTMTEAKTIEDKINKKRNELRKAHLNNMKSPEFNIQSGMIYNNIFSSCEKIGDHIENVTEAIVGKDNA